MNNDLYDSSVAWVGDVKRNIVNVSPPEKAFAELTDDKADLAILNQASQHIKRLPYYSNAASAFDYTAAIEYPFKTKPFMQTRYSDGTHPVWYGSNSIATTVVETIYHTFNQLQAIEGIAAESSVVRHRSIFNVHCDAILVDFRSKVEIWPELYSNDYVFTNKVGEYLSKNGYPGVISSSTRRRGGSNINVFKQHVLSEPQHIALLTYTIDMDTHDVLVSGMKHPVTIHANSYSGKFLSNNVC